MTLVKGIKIFPQKRKAKSQKRLMKDIRVFLKPKKGFQYPCRCHKNFSGEENKE